MFQFCKKSLTQTDKNLRTVPVELDCFYIVICCLGKMLNLTKIRYDAMLSLYQTEPNNLN